MQTKVVTSTTKGQITLPKAWRSKFNTSQFVISEHDQGLLVEPLELDTVDSLLELKNEDNYDVVFSADRDNDGMGIEVKELIKMLKELDGQN